jgi:apolipoprotein N-acyltransferase
MTSTWLSGKVTCALSLLAVAAFEAAYEFEAAGLLIVIYLACLFALAWVRTPRLAFYLGFGIGSLLAALQLTFFFGIFGPAAAGLWAILGLWIGFYLLLARIVVARWPQWGILWLPVLWFGLEYFRCELYYLRFAWLTPGLALSPSNTIGWLGIGVYGFSLATFSLLAAVRLVWQRQLPSAAAMACCAPMFLVFGPLGTATSGSAPRVVGIQLEGPTEDQVLSALDDALRESPAADLFVLSEYSFDGPIPQSVRGWCQQHQKHLIAGGKALHDGQNTFSNTAFVIAPTGESVFEQVKSVPIQFMSDGLPAREQRVWESPWGRIGVAICYDLSYARVIDRLVEEGAAALIIPTMDAESWGGHQHRLHSRVAPARAREYGIPIVRLASSGISQLVDRDGKVIAKAPFPGQGERLIGKLELANRGKLPLDRYLAIPAVLAIAGLLAFLGICSFRERWQRLSQSVSLRV